MGEFALQRGRRCIFTITNDARIELCLRCGFVFCMPRHGMVNLHEVMVRLAAHQASYDYAKQRLAFLAPIVREHGDDEFTAVFQARCLVIATHYGDHRLADHLTNHFFDDVPRTAIAEAYWRLAQGASTHYMRGPSKAIPFYVMALSLFETGESPCLQEVIARHLALSLNALADKQSAVSVLRDVGLPASIEPRPAHITLAELIVLPVM